jgi:hypothetical protein
MANNSSSKYADYDIYQSLNNMDPTLRAQQYGFNGRIFLSPDESVKPYDLFKDSNKEQETNTSIISNIVVPNALSRTFFSNDNTERLQLQIIDSVFRASQKK